MPRQIEKAAQVFSLGCIKLVIAGPSYSTTKSDQILVVNDDTAGEAVTILLPPAVENKNRELIIKKYGSTGNVIVDGNGAETIDRSLTYTMVNQYDIIGLKCDGVEWYIVTNNTGLEAELANTIDMAYDEGGAGAGRVTTADAGAFQIDGSVQLAFDINQADNFGVLELDKNGSGSGVVLKLNNAGTGLDIEGEGATWSVNKTGDGLFNRVAQAFQAVTATTSTTVDFASGNHIRVAMDADISTLTLSNPRDGERILFVLTQDGTGSRTVSWPSAVLWRGGAAPTLGGASVIDLVSMIYDSTVSKYFADVGNAFA